MYARLLVVRTIAPFTHDSFPCCRVIAWLQEKGSIAFTRLQDMQQKVRCESVACSRAVGVSTHAVPKTACY